MELDNRTSEHEIVDLVDGDESPVTKKVNGHSSSRRHRREKEVDSDDEPIINLFKK